MIQTVAVYAPATGQILRVITCPASMVELQAHDDEALLLVPVGTSDATHHIENGELVLGALDLRTLEELKAAKWSEIKRARSQAIDAEVETPYGVFDGNKISRDNITDTAVGLALAVAAGASDLVTWTLADNSTVDITLAQLQHVGLLMLAKVQTAHDTSRTLREAVELATDAEALALIQWPT